MSSAATGFAAIALRNEETPGIRYHSGFTIYDEALLHGRWVGRYWASNGFIEPERLLKWIPDAVHTPLPLSGLDMGAFQIEIDGQALHMGWEFVAAREEEAPIAGNKRAVVELRSTLRPITVEVHTESDGTGLLTRWLTIKNTGDKPLALGQAWPWSGVLFRGMGDLGRHLESAQAQAGAGVPIFQVGYMVDRTWGNEGAFEWQPLPSTPVRLESRTGKSGHSTPFFVLKNEVTGQHIVGGIAWSGNWAIELTSETLAGPDALLSFRIGTVAPSPQRVLAAGESTVTPQVHLGMLDTGLDGAIQAWHTHLRRSVLRPEYPGREGRVVLNHWSYVEHRMDEEQLKFEIDVAAEIGAEVFIVDAGWFGDKDSRWWTTVGDWDKTGNRLPNGLEPVFAYARQKGLLYGVWFDLERLGSESKTVQAHPEWLLQRYGSPSRMGDMDLTNPEAVAYIEAALTKRIEAWDLDLFRLDYNTYPWEGGQTARDGYMENTIWRYYENMYAMYDRLRARFPKLIMENCAGGGGRTDLGLVSKFSHTWVTDWQVAPRSVRILNGMSMALPPERIDRNAGVGQDSHVRGDLDFQVRSCMFGHLTLTGIYPAKGQANPDHVARIRHHVETYKRFIRPFLSTCRAYHHTPVLDARDPHGWAVLEYVAEDASRATLGAFRLAGPSDEARTIVLRGVDAGKRYRVTLDNSGQSFERDGAALLSEGLLIRLPKALTSELVLLEVIG